MPSLAPLDVLATGAAVGDGRDLDLFEGDGHVLPQRLGSKFFSLARAARDPGKDSPFTILAWALGIPGKGVSMRQLKGRSIKP